MTAGFATLFDVAAPEPVTNSGGTPVMVIVGAAVLIIAVVVTLILVRDHRRGSK